MFIPNNLTDKLELNLVFEKIGSYTVMISTREHIRNQSMDSEQSYMQRSSEINTILRTGHSTGINKFGLHDADTVIGELYKDRSFVKKSYLPVLGSVFEYLRFQQTMDDELKHILCRDIESAYVEKVITHQRKLCNSEGDIKDNASNALERIRKKINTLKARHDSMIDSVIRKYQGILMSDRITLSENRVVLQVKTGSKREMKGILHDYSDSEKTAFIEPDEFIQYNNELKDALLNEQEEIARLLEAFTDVLKSNASFMHIMDVLTKADFYNAIIRYMKDFNANYPHIGNTIDVRNARNPILLFTIGDETVPFDLETDRSLLITGPNMGGKTVILKTIGLFAMLMKMGLPVTAREGSKMPFYSHVFADIGDDQSVEKGVSTFASHLNNYRQFSQHTDSNTLILMDEVGTGTSVNEGSAFAKALIDYLLSRCSALIFTSHLDILKEYVKENTNIEYASMMYDTEHNIPLYKLHQGTMGTSGVINLIKRLEFPEEIIRRSSDILGEDYMDYAKLSMMYKEKLEEMEQMRIQLEKQKKAVDKLKTIGSSKEAMLDEKLQNLRSEFNEKKNEELKSMRRDIEHLVKQIKESKASSESIKQARAYINDTLQCADESSRKQKHQTVGIDDMVILEGDIEGTVTGVDGIRVTVDVNGVTVNTEIDSILKIIPHKHERTVNLVNHGGMDSYKLDLRGLYADEAEIELDSFIERGKSAGMETLEIIHGHGTGVLKHTVRENLKHRKDIAGYRTGLDEGLNDGVTIVYLKG